MSGAKRRRAGESACLDVPHRWLAEEAFVLAIELTRALVPDVESGTRGIKPFYEHAFSCDLQSKLLLVLKWAHRRQGAKVMAPRRHARDFCEIISES